MEEQEETYRKEIEKREWNKCSLWHKFRKTIKKRIIAITNNLLPDKINVTKK